MSGCSSAFLCLPLGSSIGTPLRERTCAAKNRMRELRPCGSVRAEDSNVLGYSERIESGQVLGDLAAATPLNLMANRLG
jgi:hypothetical protein